MDTTVCETMNFMHAGLWAEFVWPGSAFLFSVRPVGVHPRKTEHIHTLFLQNACVLLNKMSAILSLIRNSQLYNNKWAFYMFHYDL